MTDVRKHRKRSRTVVAFSIAWQDDELLARGLGLEHLQELISRLARPIVGDGLTLAYAGNWKESHDNFTRLLLRIIAAEQDDASEDAENNPDAATRRVAPLLNHLAWPHYLEVTPRIEAESVNSCRIVRVTQEDAGLTEICPDSEASFGSDLALFNAAVTISAMRERQVTGTGVDVVPGLSREEIPPVSARIAIGGKLRGFSGFAPGVFEEALLMLERGGPVYLLGGFGGATGELADRFLGASHVPSLTVERFVKETPALNRLNELCAKRQLPSHVRTTEGVVKQLSSLVAKATQTSESLVSTLNTGLSYDQTRELMTTNDIDTAVRLVLLGLRNRSTLSPAS